MDLVVAGRFRLIHCIGSGSFGEIYVGNDLQNNNEMVALKLEPLYAKYPQLQYESSVYQDLQGGCNIAHFVWFGSEAMQKIMAIQNLGRSLDTLFNFSMNQFSMKTILMIADQMISAIEFMHKKGYIHRDIKPENFLMGADKNNKNVLYIIDFGLSTQYMISNSKLEKNKQQANALSNNNINDAYNSNMDYFYHIKLTKNNKFIGNAKFQSINGHKGLTLSRRDDMEAIAYLLIYFLKGSLPWDEVTARRDKKLLFEQITQIKIKTSTEKLCQGLPKEFSQYLNSVKSLKFDEEPHYAEYRKMFKELFIKMGYIYDYDYDWTGKDYAKPISSLSLHTTYSKSTAKRNYRKENLKNDKRFNSKVNLLKNYHLQRNMPKNDNLDNNTIKDQFNEDYNIISTNDNDIKKDNAKNDSTPIMLETLNNPNGDKDKLEIKQNESNNEFSDQICIQYEKARWHSQIQFNLQDQKFNHFDHTTTETDEHKENENDTEFLFESNVENSENNEENATLIKPKTTKETKIRFYTQKENQEYEGNLQKIKINQDTPKKQDNKASTQNKKPQKDHFKHRNSLNTDFTNKNRRKSKPLFEDDIFSLSSRQRLMHSKAQKQKQQPKKIREVKSENQEFFPSLNNRKQQTRSKQKV